ncbi:MAG: sulfur carrier protein ThiS adenylyltransferase ThiF [Bacteroidales bacterium]|jgi:sulfur carrier protein ThiS adenylyltransferase|nr:sulfur carrier protein ThiS adenylyltransferase ThiF [Bacteroidales bacterium]OQB61909.1 MAG: Molybdopterin-synthase adenylyltransferase [Bacteroidetes bacterium ADurb.Bin145]HOU01877.1 sulfur carrier protein ThiS adenylyltransferase ThiF [Bacteroidales bacterium]HQK67349.1 sulfur carrier protein ThiS adenylyltransferase ThiF [Bacteroidales bacterium]
MRSSDIRNHLSRFRVGIAGAGGLGSNCAAALARSGVGTLVICDYDVIEPANLSRQYYFTNQVGTLKTIALKENIARINPDIIVLAYTEKLTRTNIPKIYSGCDIIVEAFDRDDMKEMIIETVQSEMPGVPLIVGSGVAGWGNTDSIRCRKIDDTLYVCGDESTEVSEEHPLMAPRVGIAANMQADTVVELLMKKSSDYFRL